MIRHYEARLLDPLQYHSFVDTGASGGTTTAPFLGDIALAFAINRATLGIHLPERMWVHGKHATGPQYREDLTAIGLLPTVGVAPSVEFLAPEFQASSYMSEGFEQRAISSGASYNKDKKWRVYSPVGSSSWRPWRQAQLLAPGNRFHFSLLRGPELPKRFAIRMGTGRACLIDVMETKSAPDHVTLNPWTAKHVHDIDVGNLSCLAREYPLAQYPLMHGVPIDEASEAFA